MSSLELLVVAGLETLHASPERMRQTICRLDTRQTRRRDPFETAQTWRHPRCSDSVASGSSSRRGWSSDSTDPDRATKIPTALACKHCRRGAAAAPQRPSASRAGRRLAGQGPTEPICLEPCCVSLSKEMHGTRTEKSEAMSVHALNAGSPASERDESEGFIGMFERSVLESGARGATTTWPMAADCPILVAQFWRHAFDVQNSRKTKF